MDLLRKLIRNALHENSSVTVSEEIIRNTIANYNASSFGYTVLNVVRESTEFMDELVYTITLQHTKPNFKKYIDKMISKGGKFARIYGDTPSSKTMITRWLTGFRDGADIDTRQKSAAIKIAQVAGLDALAPLVKSLESTYDCTCVANFTGAKTKNKGLSFFEFYVFDNSNAVTSGPPEISSPTKIPVDEEVIELPPELAAPPKKTKKPRKQRKKKAPKLSSKQKKAGYNQINLRGDVRHVTSLDELESIEDHIVNIITKDNYDSIKDLAPDDAHDMYNELRNLSESNDSFGGKEYYFRVVDDYYNEPLPRLVFYGGSVYWGGRIRSKSMMQQYLSLHSDRIKITNTGSDGDYMEDPLYGTSPDTEEYTPPKLGGKEAKDVRRLVQQTRTSDELIIYARISPSINKYTNKISRHTGKIDLYVFQLDRRFRGEEQ